MQKKLLLFFFISFLTNCKQRIVDPTAVSTVSSTTGVSAARKSYTETIVILGSSTAEGIGASSYQYSWAGMLSTRFPLGRVINLARGGYTTYHMLPTGTSKKTSRPVVDTLRNITAALKQKPTILILTMTTNDVANGHSVEEIITNLNIVRSKALAAGVAHVLITTSHPRKISAAATANYLLQRDQVLKTYGLAAINFFDPVANADNLFKEELLSGDGIHPNNKGHKILYEQMKKAITLNLLH